jgi:hypothetical protein
MVNDLQKSLPLILAIIGQTAAIVWYVSSLAGAVERNTRDVMRQDVRIENLESIVQTQAVTLARIDENIKSIREAVESMANAND